VRIARVPAHVVYVVAGPAGSGKSTLGRALAFVTGAVVIDQDIATNPLMAQLAALVGAGDDLDHPALRGAVRRARYQCIIDIACDNGRLGRNVVMIAPFTAESADPGAWAGLVRQLAPARVVLVWVTVPPELALARRVQRNLPRDRTAGQLPPPMSTPEPAVEFVAASGAVEAGGEARRVASLIDASADARSEALPQRD
jgi:predicted kinase